MALGYHVWKQQIPFCGTSGALSSSKGLYREGGKTRSQGQMQGRGHIVLAASTTITKRSHMRRAAAERMK